VNAKCIPGKQAAKDTAPRRPVPLEQAMANAVARVRRMTPSEQRQSLIKAGILTTSGDLARPYR
jgi:hypothetical protein